jgi:hypothetical protein
MPSSRSSNASQRNDRRDHHNHCRRNCHRGDNYYYYEYENGPNPLALYLLSRPYVGYGGLGYGGLGYGGPVYGRPFW